MVALEELPHLVNPHAAAHRSPNTPEPYVDAAAVARHLSVKRRQVLELTRKKKLPAYPVDAEAARKTYRYKLSEVERAIRAGALGPRRGDGLGAGPNSGDNAQGSSRSQMRKNSNG
jgi:hypothetical protein